MDSFAEEMRVSQIRWRRAHLSNQIPGRQNGREYDHILPWDEWELNVWPGMAKTAGMTLPDYLNEQRIRKHTGSHNLLSSWVLTANLYFPFRGPQGRRLLAGFLHDTLAQEVRDVSGLELEYESPDPALTPMRLLGETDGSRGAGQTSPDVAFEVDTLHGPGVILVESKFTEHNFYPCSGRKKNPSGRTPNPDPSRCLDAAAVASHPDKLCHLPTWGRRYWNHLAPVSHMPSMRALKSCPAAFGAYQLFRQQALAEGLATSGRYSLVVSAVAFDARNSRLMTSSARTSGIQEIRSDWAGLFNGRARFAVFTHQDWVSWVEEHSPRPWHDWLKYMRERYGLGES